MGKGAPKRIENVPTVLWVNVYAAEGLMNHAAGELRALLKLAAHNPEDGKWNEIRETREKLFLYTKQYTRAVMQIENHMEKG